MRTIAFDFGDRRTGVAVCDPEGIVASSYDTIIETGMKNITDAAAQMVLKANAKKIVVGNPINMDGTKGYRSKRAEEFAENLEKLTGIKPILWDERCTTVEATRYLNATDRRGKKRKDVIDTLSAQIILQGYLNFLQQQK